jgi:hypothetical protein
MFELPIRELFWGIPLVLGIACLAVVAIAIKS